MLLGRAGIMLAFAWLGCAGLVLGSSPEWGRTVTRVDLKSDAELDLSQFKKQIVQQIGKPLDPARVDESLKELYATGRFTDLRADAEPAPGGVELVFVGKAQYFVGLVQVAGTFKPLGPSSLVAAARLPLGNPLNEQVLARAKISMQRVLADNGYYRPEIQTRIVRDPVNQVANVLFTINSGPQASVSKIIFEGQSVYPAARLNRVAGWKAGDHLTSSEVEKGLFKIHEFYMKRGYLQANTTIRKRVFEPKTNTEELHIESEAGPMILVRVRGAKISTSKLRNVLPLYQDGVTDEPALRRGAEALRDFFQQKGYFHASVSVAPITRPKPNQLQITYTVNRGAWGEYVGYKFVGNHYLPDIDLLPAMTIHPAGLFFESAAFSEKQLAQDIDSLKALYQSRGFLDTTITPHFDYYYRDQPNHLFVTLDIQEGVQTLVGNLTLQGVTADRQKELLPHLANRPGHPYSPQNEQKDRNTILQYFANHGYTHAKVDTSSSPSSTSHVVDVDYRVEPGREEYIQRIVLLGNTHTRDGVVQRELSFRPGEPANESNLLESQRRLYDLGLFNQVQIAPENPGTTETKKSILVNMEEARRWTLGYGGGLEVQRLGSNEPQGQLKASPRVSLDLSRLNVGGRNQTASFQGRFSALDKAATLGYLIPMLPSHRDISVRFNASAEYSRNVLTFTAKREEASFLVEKRWSPATFLSARYSFRNVQALDLSNRISANQIPLFSLPARIGMFALSYVNDHRDNPVNPTRGSYSMADAGVSWSGFGSEADFLRFSAQNSTYYRLGPHLIFARDTRFAVESPYGGLRSVVVTDANGQKQVVLTHDIPLPERFFMGGSDSHRGFSINQAGPRDPETGFPIGGNALFLNSLELRMPFDNDRFGVVLFHDMGNVYSSIRKMRLFKVTQNSPTDFDYTVHAVGVGLLYTTPVGPLSFDVGYALNPPNYQVAVPGGTEVRQLSHVQYFLSIGQSF
ncbi:MAG: outer membrane protein assembly factor BamA [Acidobacteria bacterium]|nr:outer membrane protein assembly factor BamA [Acidobacteriota bacterium]